MSLSRREFTAAAASLVTLSVLGCDSNAQSPPAPALGRPGGPSGGAGNPNRAQLATEPFLIGPPSKYAKPGVYDDFKKPAGDPQNKGVWIVSDGTQVAALSATCTHSGCTTHWKADDKVFDCPCHHSKFSTEGINREGSKAKRALERCTVSLVDSDTGKQIQVDPTRRLKKEAGEWDDPAAAVKIA